MHAIEDLKLSVKRTQEYLKQSQKELESSTNETNRIIKRMESLLEKQKDFIKAIEILEGNTGNPLSERVNNELKNL